MAAPPSSYRAVDLSSLCFEPVAKQGKLYVANLGPPLQVLTPPVELVTAIEQPFAYVRPAGDFAAFLRRVEEVVLEESIRRKAEWFRKDIDDDALRHNFKSFFREGGDFKVKVAEDVCAFSLRKEPLGPEDVRVGQTVRCVLELGRVCFGRQEFGAMWRLVQAREVEVPPCLIADDDEGAQEDEQGSEQGGGEGDDADETEFL